MRGIISPKSQVALPPSGTRSEALAELSAKVESLLESMQTPAARQGVDAAFNATPEELGRAAVEAARRRS
jgi:antitoxin Phd